MAYLPKLAGYVKFLRGTPAAWESITNPDSDTLYFIAEGESTTGKLYLGSKLIADGETITITKLDELEDVIIGAGVPADGILIWDQTQNDGEGAWVPTTLDAAFAKVVKVFEGATEEDPGRKGLVPAPTAGSQDLYLRGDATWANPTEVVEQQVGSLQDALNKEIQDRILAIKTLLGGYAEGTTISQIAIAEIAKIVDGAPEAFDTLKEIATWIQEHDAVIDIEKIVAAVNKIEETLYTKDTGVVDQVADLYLDMYGDGGSITGVKQDVVVIQQQVVSLDATLKALRKDHDALAETVADVDNRLRWQDLTLE